MSQPRLLLFLSDVEGNLTALRQTLKRVCDDVGIPPPEVQWAEGPSEFMEAGWHVADIRLLASQGAVSLEAHLEAAVAALCQDFRDRALGLYADRVESYGRACLSSPGKPPRVVEGEMPEILHRTAAWLDVSAPALARLLGGTSKNVLAAAVDFDGDAPAAKTEPLAPPEPDDDDRFVEAKLAQARVLMAQYLGHRK